MVNVGINIRYIGSYKLRLWVFTSFSVDLICITTFFYTSTGGARWEYHSAAWLNHESNHHFSGHDPIMSRDLCCIPSPWLPWFFYEFLSVLSEKQNTHTHTKKHLQVNSHVFFPKWMGVHQLDAAGKIVELLRCSNLGINTQIICQWKNRSNFYEQMTMISPSYRSSGIETIRWSHWSFEIKSERCCRVQDSGRTGGYSSFGGSICSPVGDDNHWWKSAALYA